MRQKKLLTCSVLNRPFIIPIFIPDAGCPHKCAFCNQPRITGTKQGIPSPERIRRICGEFLSYKRKQRKNVQIAFYGGNFMGLRTSEIGELLGQAAHFAERGAIDGIRFSTRPDTIDHTGLELIKDFPVSTVELGVQSMDDRVLEMARRGHSAQDTVTAVRLLKARNYEIGLQMMVGLPGDREAGALHTARRIADMRPDFVRIYPVLVLEGSLLGRWYEEGRYTPLSLEKCVRLVKDIYLLFAEKKIPVIRMGLQASEALEKESLILAGPYHPAFGHLVHSEIFLDKAVSAIESVEPENAAGNTVLIRVNPRNISKMRGLKNRNIQILRNRFHLRSLKITSDPLLSEEELSLETQKTSLRISPQSENQNPV